MRLLLINGIYLVFLGMSLKIIDPAATTEPVPILIFCINEDPKHIWQKLPMLTLAPKVTPGEIWTDSPTKQSWSMEELELIIESFPIFTFLKHMTLISQYNHEV